MRRTMIAATVAAILLTACHYTGTAAPTPTPAPAPAPAPAPTTPDHS